MFNSIDFYIHDGCVEIAGKEFQLGELTCDILNISPDEFEKMRQLAEKLDGSCDEKIMQQLHGMLTKYKLFQLIKEPETYGIATQYQHIISDIYSFNETVFHFIDKFIMRLNKLNSGNYAAALYDFYHHPSLDKMMVNHFRNGLNTFTLFDNIEVRYKPREISGQPDNYAIYEIYSVAYLQAFLKMDFMKAIMAGHTFRRCRNCKRFFLLTQGYKTDYCDRPLAANPKRTCRQQGAKNTAKEKAKNNPVIHSYSKAYRRIMADKRRGNITEQEWDMARNKLKDLRDMAVSGKLSDAEVDRLMQSGELYQMLGIKKNNQ